MAETRHCPVCRTALPVNAPEGFCPVCEFRRALEPPDGSGSSRREEAQSEKPEIRNPTSEVQEGPTLSDLKKIRYFGDYELLEEIAHGGMGTVFKARQVTLNRLVALKLISAGVLASHELVKRFKAEAEAAAVLDHPNIVPIHEIGEHAGQHYFSMTFIDGPTLGRALGRKPMPTRRTAQLLVTLARAVHFAHQRGVLHRDLKPGNILLDAQGEPHLTDFGLAKFIQKESTLTHTNAILGSPAYMSPEQARGDTKAVTTATDVYGLGAVLYETLTGTPPFGGGTWLETIRQVLDEEPRRPSLFNPDVDRDLETICLRCLEKEPARRYESAVSVAEDLERWLRREPIQARPSTVVTRVTKWMRRKPAVASLVIALHVIFALGLAGVLWQWQRARDEASRNRQNLYVADMNLAQQALKASNLGRARQLLERNRPRSSEPDLRHWEWRYLWQQCQGDALFVLDQEADLACSLSFSPDGKWLAVGGFNGLVKIWDVAARREVATLQRRGQKGLGAFSLRGDRVAATIQKGLVAFSPRGDRLAATTQEGMVKVWEAGSWNEVLELRHGAWIRSMSVSADGKRLAFFGQDQKLSLWSLEETNQIASLQTSGGTGRQDGVVLFSPDNQWLAVGETDGVIRILELATLTERFTLVGTVQPITTLAFSPDGGILASGSGFADGAIGLWSPASRTNAGWLKGHGGWICGLAFSPDGKLLASASADQTIRLWDTEKWESLAILRGHQDEVWALAFSPDGQTLVSGSKDGSIYFWSASPRPKFARPVTLPDIKRASISADGQTLATRNSAGSVSLIDLASLQEVCRLTELGTNNTGVLFSPRGRVLAVGERSGVIKLWDPARPGELRRLVGPQAAPIEPVDFTRDGQLLLSIDFGEAGDRCTVWAVDSGKELASWSLPPGSYREALSHDGKLVVRGDTDGTVRFRDIASGREEALLEAHKYFVSGIAFSPDDKVLATGSWYGDTKLWDVATRVPLATLRGHLHGVHGVRFSPDGRRLATAGGKGEESVKLWDLATQQEVATLEGTGYTFWQMQFSPDGNALFAISTAGTLHLWRAPSFAEIEAAERPPATRWSR